MNDRHKTERLGVNAVEKAFLKMGWVFRDQPSAILGLMLTLSPQMTMGQPDSSSRCR